MKKVLLLLVAACAAAFGIMLASASTSTATINCGWSEEDIAGQGGDYTKMPKDNPGRVYTPCPSTPKPTPVPPKPKPKPVPKPKPPKPVAPSVPQPSVPNVTPAGNPNPAPARPSVKTPKKKGPQPVVYGSVGEGPLQAATEPPCVVPVTEDSFPWWLLIVGAGLGIIGDRLFIAAAARRKNTEEEQELEPSDQETDTATSEDADVAGFTTTK